MPMTLTRRLPGAAPAAPAPSKATAPAPSPAADMLLTPAEVAQHLRVTPKALEHWRRRGDGPQFVRLSRSRVRYRAEDVASFLAGRTLRSTAG